MGHRHDSMGQRFESMKSALAMHCGDLAKNGKKK